jgi:prepilin-type N-terminal cleavage/methylation domain-containing protein
MQERDKKEQGFTLIELLIAIVVVGILTAVAIVGIAGLTNKGNGSACAATMDAARTASAVHYANTNPSVYPATFGEMETTTPPELELASGVSGTGTTLTGKGWTVDMTPGAAGSEPTFVGHVTATNALCETGTGA